MKIFLIRHGQTDYNKNSKLQGRIDIELNRTGLNQSEILGKRLSTYGLTKIYTSDLKRAVQTAKVIEKHTGADVCSTPLLREIDMGDWQGLNWDQIKQNYPKYYADWSQYTTDMPYPGGECGKSVIKRFQTLISQIELSDYDNLVMVTHSGLIKTVVSSLLCMPVEKRFFITVENCSISVLSFDRELDRLRVLRLNDSAHFENAFNICRSDGNPIEIDTCRNN